MSADQKRDKDAGWSGGLAVLRSLVFYNMRRTEAGGVVWCGVSKDGMDLAGRYIDMCIIILETMIIMAQEDVLLEGMRSLEGGIRGWTCWTWRVVMHSRCRFHRQ
jgi:hypothetical protein